MACEICGKNSCSRSFHSLQAQEDFDKQPKDLDAALDRVAELEAQNRTLRNAQKACEFCDEPRVSRIAELEAQLAESKRDAKDLYEDIKRLTDEAYKKDEQFAAVTTELDGLRSALVDLEYQTTKLNRFRDRERHPDACIALANARTVLSLQSRPEQEKLAAVTAERDELRRDAERLDLIAQLFEHKWNGVIDSGSRTDWSLVGPYRHVVAKMEGKTFREAIDAALQPDRRKGARRKYTRITADRRKP
jgi:myosin heavy subunit